MLQQTSIEAYEGLVESGKINKRQEQVLNVLSEHPFPHHKSGNLCLIRPAYQLCNTPGERTQGKGLCC